MDLTAATAEFVSRFGQRVGGDCSGQQLEGVPVCVDLGEGIAG